MRRTLDPPTRSSWTVRGSTSRESAKAAGAGTRRPGSAARTFVGGSLNRAFVIRFAFIPPACPPHADAASRRATTTRRLIRSPFPKGRLCTQKDRKPAGKIRPNPPKEDRSRMSVEPGKIRNVAVVGHRGTGKTSLLEAMLFQAGAVNRLGNVEGGSTVSDWDEEEQRRQMSLQASLCHLDWQDRKINLIDTPGDAGFQG